MLPADVLRHYFSNVGNNWLRLLESEEKSDTFHDRRRQYGTTGPMFFTEEMLQAFIAGDFTETEAIELATKNIKRVFKIIKATK